MTDLKNVLCVKWGSKFSADYVNRLYNMVERHLTLTHRFICLTDDPTGLHPLIETRPLLRKELKKRLVSFSQKNNVDSAMITKLVRYSQSNPDLKNKLEDLQALFIVDEE